MTPEHKPVEQYYPILMAEIDAKVKQAIADFYRRVCVRAEANMALTGTVSGAHWNALRQELAVMGIEVE